ncbi:MAG TPA: DUF192 domain-containing protein [Gemmatimonadaceae bacterium]|jgi:hypothetical protein|nr:DUF192 domain-containing protein [Gemmatimonadaceae bacterium]
MKRFAVIALALGASACSGKGVTDAGSTPPTIPVTFTGGTITAQIASTSAARENGLMNVTTLGADAGMLFVFATDHPPANCAFWMQDTPVALSIAFIDANMKVINIEDMAAETTTFHEPTSACRYALETNQGWFASHGVTAGSTVTFALPAGTIVDP